MSGTNPKNLLYLFDRPSEPIFIPKGTEKAVFDVPPDYLVERYRPLQNDLVNRFGSGETISVNRISLPDLSIPQQLKRTDNFSLFLPHHRKLAHRLIEIFMGMRNVDDFMSAAAYCRDRINPYLFIYALSVAILHRPDTKRVPVPSLCEVFPDKFIDGTLFAQAKEESNIIPEGQQIPLEIPRDYTATNLEIEHRLAYFREDLGINLHHWHWHLVYPNDAPMNLVAKDRRGELFYYMHQQILARYNFERFCNHLGRVKRLNNWDEPLEEGYFPKLDSLTSSRVWPPRFANTKLRDIFRETEQIKFDLQDLQRWRDRIFAAIHSGIVINNRGETVELTETGGIDILGDMIEASTISINRNLYGDLHNLGHVAIALVHDPDHRNLETFSVMGDPATAMRDPIFYRWHAFIDDIFQEHKNTLPRYTVEQLNYPGIKITQMEVRTSGKPRNQFATFWQKSNVDLTRGLDFTPRGNVFARFTHLQHTPFTYQINVENVNKTNKRGTVRIFIAPKNDERGTPMFFRDQRSLFVELDKFAVNLKPGKNTVTRKSSESSVTIPFDRTFRNLDRNRPANETPEADSFNFCGCGWPQHMLIAKGTPDGFPCQLFVMISNFDGDSVDALSTQSSCSDAASYCGVRDSLYPDRRSMGYPFDRQPRNGVDFINQFLTQNMGVLDVTINFTNTTVTRQTA